MGTPTAASRADAGPCPAGRPRQRERGLPMIGRTLVTAALAALGTALTLAAPAVAAEPPAGIYQVWGSDRAVERPYVKGGQITLEWSQLEPARGRFAWGALDRELAYYRSIGKVATVQVNSTSGKPRWIWNADPR